MKRQFAPIQLPQRNEQHAQQVAIPGQPGVDEAPLVDVTTAEATLHPTVQQQFSQTGGGLLSRWKTGELQHFANEASTAMMRQETLVLSPVTEEVSRAKSTPLPFPEQVAPPQSGITPQSLLFTNWQPLQHSASQPLRPAVGNYSQTLPPLFPQPIPSQASMPGMPGGYQSVPPPFVQGYMGQGAGRRPHKKRRVPMWARVALSVLLLLLITGGSVAGYYYYTLSTSISSITGQTVTRLHGDDNYNSRQNTSSGILSGGRINILLLGSDTDQKFAGVYLAQTDIVVTIDPKTKSVGMLSIPRDTWLNVPDHGMMKLDEAYSYGGVALSRATIHQDFGIYIDYYAWVGLDGFIKVIDTVGGVDVDVLHPIVDDNYPDDIGKHGRDIFSMKRLYLSPGPQHLSGPQALEYVRSRHADLMGDFGRSTRQQQVLTQLKAKLSNPAMISKVQELANDLQGYVKTDMQLNEVLELMNFARSLDQNKIKRVTLGNPYSSLINQKTSDGVKSVVILNCTLVQPLMAQMFDLGDNAKCDTQAHSGNSSALPTVHLSPPSLDTTSQMSMTSLWQILSRVSLISQSSIGNELLGVHSLLDLLFLVVFESPIAIQP
jgi:LCP family protein required for cell wall assembly